MLFHFALGHVGGVEAVGVASSVLAMTWVAGSFGSLGLPDRAMYGVARDDTDASLGAAHGLFLMLAGAGAVAVLGIVTGLRMGLALLPHALVLGTFLQHAAAFVFSGLRGASRPRLETVASLLSAVLLLAASSAALAQPRAHLLPLGFVLAGLVVPMVALLGVRAHPALRPRRPSFRHAVVEVRTGVPYLVVGAGGMLLGTADLIAAQLWLDSERVGLLQCATFVTRTGLNGPWILSVLALKALGERASSTQRVVAASLVAWSLSCVIAWVAIPWIGLGYAVDAVRFSPATYIAIALSLPSYLAVGLMPRAMMRHQTGTVRVFVALGVVAPALFWAGAELAGITGLQVAHAAAHAILAVAFAALLFGGRAPSEPQRRQAEPPERTRSPLP
jgi:hypothetical protein